MSNYNNKSNKNQVIEKCKEKRNKNSKFNSYIKPFISDKMSLRIKDCGSFLEFLSDEKLENKKLNSGNFCKNRFCPMCSWRLSCKDSLKISVLMEYLRAEHDKEFIFLTLTTPNVEGDKLNNAILEYNKAFKRLVERKEVEQILKGYLRKLEVTYNSDISSKSYNTYHPHFHVVIAVNKSYFKKSDLYIKRDKWLKLWQEATGDTSITQVDVRKAKNGDLKAVYELAKYSAKDMDYLASKSVFKTFYDALKGKQLIVYSKLFKDAHKLFKAGMLDNYKHRDDIEYIYKLYYSWNKNEYINTRLKELTEEEKKTVNKRLIEQIEIE